MAFSEGTQFQMFVTHVEGEGPNIKVFGQVDKQNTVLIESVLSAYKPSFEGGVGRAPPGSIRLGMLCIAKYGDGDYYRAKVTNVNDISNGMVSVYFIDFGNNDVVNVHVIRLVNNLPDIIESTPPQARDFLLARLAHPKGVWDSTMQMTLNKLIYYEEIACVVELVAFEKYFIKMIYKGHDLAETLTRNGFGIQTTVEEQKNLLHKVLNSTRSVHHETGRMYIPPPARLTVGDAGVGTPGSREAFRGYIPPQAQTTMDVGRTVGKVTQPQSRAKVKSVVAPRPLRRSVEDGSPPSYVDRYEPAAATQNVSAPPTTYQSRHLSNEHTHQVHVSYAKDGPKCFAIQLKSDEVFLSNIVSKINSVPPQPLTGPPMIGSVCLGRFSEDKTLCRAVVLSSTESYCKLFFVDFGITESVSYSDIFQISESDVKPDVFALRFSLSGIANLQVTEKIKNDFYQIVNNQVLTLKVVPPEGPPLLQYCELYLDGRCVKEMLLHKQNPTFRKINVTSIIGKNLVLVSYVDSCTKFYIQLSKNIDGLNEVMDNVAAYCQQAQPLLYHQVRCGMSCCAIFPDDQSWYRAIVTNIKKDKITVNYVDYGNEQELTCDMLRSMTPELSEMEAQAVHCALKGFEDKPFDQKTCDSLEQLTLEKILSMDVHGVMEGGVLLVDLVDESTIPAMDIASAVYQATMAPPSEAVHTSTPQESFDTGAISPAQTGYSNNHFLEPQKDNVSDTSFGSNRGNNEEFNSRPKKNFGGRERGDNNRSIGRERDNNNRSGGRERGDNNRNEPAPGRGNRDDRNRNFGEKTNRKYAKSNVTDKNSGPHYPSESKSQSYRLNRKSYSDNTSYDSVGGSISKSQHTHPRDSKPDWSNKNQRGDGGRKFSDRSSDKEYSGEKRSYGGEHIKSYKPRNYESQECPKVLTNPIAFNTPFNDLNVVIGQEYEVRVTWFINPNDFFVTMVSEENQFRNMMFNVPTLYTGVKPAFSHEVSVGSSVLARFSEDKALYRAQILDSQYGGKFKVQFIDYGNKCMVDGSDIWQLENDLMSMPKMALHCSLKGISPTDKEWKPNHLIDDCFSLSSYKAIFYSLDNNKYSVSLVNQDSGDVGQTLIEKQLAICTEQPASSPANKVKVYITHIDTPGQFWLQCESDSDKIDTLQEILQNAETYDDCVEREVGQLCISKYSADEQYYRTIILDSDNDIITVRFIDYGNTDVLDNTPGVLKCLPTEMHDVEPYALKCSVNATPTGTGQWTEQASELFTKLIGNTEEPVDAVFILKGATTYVDLFVNSINITDQLVSQGQAVRSEKSDQMPTCFASHVNSPSEFWIQLESAVHDLEAISEELVDAEEFSPLNEIAEEVICAAKFPEDDLWYRAQVIIHGSDGTEVLFMDYGNSSLTNDLRSLPDNLKTLPALSRKCALQKPGSIKMWSKEAELKFIELAADGATVFNVSFIASGDTSIVELYVDGKSVTEQLSLLCHQEVSSVPSPQRLPVIGEDKIPTSAFICHSNSPEDFWIQYGSSTDNLNFIMSLLENASEFNSLENMTEGTICASIFSEDNLYYRSKIISHSESGTEVFHIDFGSTALTDDLRELSKELIDIPALAKHCSLLMPHDRSKINEEIHEKFADLAVDDSIEYNVEIIDSESDPMVVKLLKNDQDIAEVLGYKYENHDHQVIDNVLEDNTCKNVDMLPEQIENEKEIYSDQTFSESTTKLEYTHVVETMSSRNTDETEEVTINTELMIEATSSLMIDGQEQVDLVREKKTDTDEYETTSSLMVDGQEQVDLVREKKADTDEYETTSSLMVDGQEQVDLVREKKADTDEYETTSSLMVEGQEQVDLVREKKADTDEYETTSSLMVDGQEQVDLVREKKADTDEYETTSSLMVDGQEQVDLVREKKADTDEYETTSSLMVDGQEQVDLVREKKTDTDEYETTNINRQVETVVEQITGTEEVEAMLSLSINSVKEQVFQEVKEQIVNIEFEKDIGIEQNVESKNDNIPENDSHKASIGGDDNDLNGQLEKPKKAEETGITNINELDSNVPAQDEDSTEVDSANVTESTDNDGSNGNPVAMCEDEDKYSDISNTSESADPEKEIMSFLDACKKDNNTNGNGDNINSMDTKMNKSQENITCSDDELQNNTTLSAEKLPTVVATTILEDKISKVEKCSENNNATATE